MNTNAYRNGQSHSREGSSNAFSSGSHQKPQTAFNGEYGGAAGRTQIGRVTSQTRLNYTPLAQVSRVREHENVSPLPPPARQSEMISGLRSQLLNIRSEVSKLLVDKSAKNTGEEKTPLGKRLNTFQDQINAVEQIDGRASQAVRPKGETSLRCLQVENQSLKNELSGLKKRYTENKHAHEQEVTVLNKKVKVLELTLKTNQENILAYKGEIEKEMTAIRDQLTDSKIEVKKAEMEREIERYRQQAKVSEENVKKLEKQLLDTRRVYTDRLNECEAQIGIVHERMLEKSELIGRLREEILVAKAVIIKESYQCDTQTDVQVDEEKESQKKYIQILREECSNLTNTLAELTDKLKALQDKTFQSTTVQTDAIQAVHQTKQPEVIEVVKVVQVPAAPTQQYDELKRLYDQKVEELRAQEIVESQRFSQMESQADSLRAQITQLDRALAAALREVTQLNKQLNALHAKHEEQLASLIPKQSLKTVQSPPKEAKSDLKQYTDELQTLNERLLSELNFRDRELEDAKAQIKQLTELYCQVTEEIGLKDRQLNDLHNQLTDKLNIECQRNDSLQNRVESAELDYKAMLGQLKTEIRQLVLNRPTMEGKTFDEALKVQIGEINELKSMVNRKSEEIYQLKDHITCNRSQVESIKAELEIEKLKAIAERKNMQVGFEVELQKVRNSAQAERKTAESVSSKLRTVVQQTRGKDEFIQKYIMGRRISPDEKFQVEEFFKQYRLDFPTNKLKERLNAEAQEIHRLQHANQRLVLEISTLRLDKHTVSSDAPTQISSDPSLPSLDCY